MFELLESDGRRNNHCRQEHECDMAEASLFELQRDYSKNVTYVAARLFRSRCHVRLWRGPIETIYDP